jgi:8-oxo-dGTP pyrophosphatase MutT (NUDIX family)
VIDAATGWYFVHASIKAVVLCGEDVLLCRNNRDRWELPGGWPSREDVSLADVVRREVREETGLDVVAGPVVGATLLRIADAGPVVVVGLLAHSDRVLKLEPSDEHSEVRFFPVDHLPDALDDEYRELIDVARARDIV